MDVEGLAYTGKITLRNALNSDAPMPPSTSGRLSLMPSTSAGFPLGDGRENMSLNTSESLSKGLRETLKSTSSTYAEVLDNVGTILTMGRRHTRKMMSSQ